MYLYISQEGWYLTGASILFIILFVLFLVFFIKVRERQNELIMKEQKTKNEYEKTLLHSQLEIQEQTLKNISQEIHDNIGQSLSLAKLTLNTMLPVTDKYLEEKIVNSKQMVGKAIADLRDLSRSLDTDYVKEMGLQRAIEYELEMMHKTGAMRTALEVEGSVIRFDKQKELILFRIIQETFNNIIKHADATDLEVTVYYRPYEMELIIADNGKGVDLTPLTEGNNSSFGLGIRNMHNRAKLIGADFSMSSTVGLGTQVKIVLPTETINDGNN
jgi:two-component system NarL family sensor kinase